MADEHFESMKVRVSEALAMHAKGEVDTDELIQRLEHVRDSIDNAHADVRTAIWTAVNGLIDNQYLYDEADRSAALRDVRSRLVASMITP